MQRFVLAIIILAALAALAAAWLRASRPSGPAEAQDRSMVRQVSFALLMGLMGYVALAGGD